MALRDLFTRQIPGEPKTPVVGRTPAFPPPRDSIIVNPEVSMSVSAVYRSVAILSTLIRQMPIQVLRDNDQIDSKLGDRPDIEVPREEFMEQTAKSLLLHGNAYWLASRDTTGQVMNLTVIRPSSIVVTDANAGTSPIPRATYHIGGTDVTRDIYHARLNTNPGEVVGYGPLQSCPLDVQAIIKLRNYSDAFFEIGSPVGVLSSDQFLNQEQADEMRERWHEVMRERTIAVLGNGLEYKSVWTDPKQAQFVENVQAAVTNIARLFGIPTMLLASGIDGTSLTYANLNELNQSMVQTTLQQLIQPIEAAFSDALPRGQEARIKLDSLLRGDIDSRMAAYKAMVEMGAMSPDEVRASEGISGPAPAPTLDLTQPKPQQSNDASPV